MKTKLIPLSSFLVFSCAAFGQIEPMMGYATSVETRRAHVTDRVFDATIQPDGQAVSVGGRYLDRSIRQKLRGVGGTYAVARDAEGFGARAAYQRPWRDFVFGISVDYETVESDFDERTANVNHGRVDSDTVTAAASARYDFGDWSFFLQGGAGWSDHDAHRVSAVPGRKEASFDGDDYFGIVRLERGFAVGEGIGVRPFVAASASRVKVDGFNESAGADARVVSGDSFSESLAYAGVTVDKDFGRIAPYVSVAWVRKLSSSDIEFERVGGGGIPDEVIPVTTPFTDLFVAEIGASAGFADHWAADPFVRFIGGDDDTRWSFGIAVRREL